MLSRGSRRAAIAACGRIAIGHRGSASTAQWKSTDQQDGLSVFLRDVQRAVENDEDKVDLYDGEEMGEAGPSSQVFDPTRARRTPAAQHGSCRAGSIQVPPALQANVQTALDRIQHKSTVRTAALGLYEHFRSTSKADRSLPRRSRPPGDASSAASLPPHDPRVVYDTLTALAYSAGAMPSVYAATRRALEEVKRRWPPEATPPRRVFDWGCGTGSAGWAAKEIWTESLVEYVGIDRSSSMLWLAEELLGGKGKGRHTPGVDLATIGEHHENPPSAFAMKTSFHKTSVTTARKESTPPPSRSASTFLESPFAMHLPASDQPGDVAIMAFTLSDLPRRSSRLEAVLALWNSGAETIVVIDRGTPKGFQMVAEAREQLLTLGKRPRTAVDEVEEGTEEASAEPPEGSWVLAPCPHDGACPLHRTTNFCHFSQRLERPRFLRQTKHSTTATEDAKFSYVVIRRGQRPAATLPDAKSVSADSSHSDADGVTIAATSEPQIADEGADMRDMDDGLRVESLRWPRIILPPSKPKGHVVLDVCAPSGQIERLTVPKSYGRQAYYDARKASWGDAWPHGSKKPGLVKSQKPLLPVDDDGNTVKPRPASQAADEVDDEEDESGPHLPTRRENRGLARKDRKKTLRQVLETSDVMSSHF